MANVVSGDRWRDARMKSRACCLVYGCGNASRRLIQMLRLFAWRAIDSTSDVSHERTSQVFKCSSMVPKCNHENTKTRRRSPWTAGPSWLRGFVVVFALHHVLLTRYAGMSESLERERRDVEDRIAADDEVGQDTSRGRRVLKAMAAETVE